MSTARRLRAAGLLAAAAALLLSAPAATQAFTLERADAGPAKAFFDSRDPIAVTFRFADPAPADVTVEVQGRGRTVRTINLKQLEPGMEHRVEWDGLSDSRKPVPDGKYRFRVGPSGGGLGDAGAVTLHGHRYPVRAPHGFRGPVGEFRAPRNGGRWHHGFDIVARCGAPLVAVRAGTVIVERFDGRLDGHYIVIRGRKEGFSYRYSHLPRESRLDVGDDVKTGDPVGVVGRSGNAASVGCHLHFEVKRGGRWVDPWPLLRVWDRFS